ncbi:unnamed protein product [Kuraishia capsulata CBS 1993]|uniref:Uncharacterized protein n=1 Tax=Kuraishia capsulata CBS 1993 TaxID=1382522 RepID=W6MNE1_9ASCO|nr:uncharacterized protein KUCA_T00003777001 [Kuraishia capsulata CBS 1993]CDK27798.1 unnamed protein product [Kuraishia capsulata CBS 1993]
MMSIKQQRPCVGLGRITLCHRFLSGSRFVYPLVAPKLSSRQEKIHCIPGTTAFKITSPASRYDWKFSHRSFSSTSSLQIRRGVGSNGVFSLVPDSVKVFGLALGIGSVVVFVALPIATIVVPPVLLGGWLFARTMLRRRRKELDTVMEKLKSTKLRYEALEPELEIGDTNLAKFALQRFTYALQDNEQSLDEIFEMGSQTYRLALGPIESHNQEWRFRDGAYALLGIERRGIIDKNSEERIGTMSIATLSSTVHNPLEAIISDSFYNMVIEVTPKGRLARTYTIDTPKEVMEGDDEIIDVQGRTRDQ